MNRLDDIVIFNPLGLEQITYIVEILFKGIQKKLVERDIHITLEPSAKEFIAKVGFDPTFGARPLKRALYEEIEDRLADLILEGKIKEGSKVAFYAQNDAIQTRIE